MRKTFRLQGRWAPLALLTACFFGSSILVGCGDADPGPGTGTGTATETSGTDGNGGASTAEDAGATGPRETLLPAPGEWRGALVSPGGPLTFGLEILIEPEGLRAVLVNGNERRPAGLIKATADGIEFAIPPYQSRIVATVEESGSALVGTWQRDRGKGMADVLPFAGILNNTPPEIPPLSEEARASISGRWAVQFAGDEDPSVGLFEVDTYGMASGTFMTTLGDYRYLSGFSDGNSLFLTCFDGAHAFLFAAKKLEDGSLKGDFWSRDSYHTTWTATKSRDAQLPDDFALTEWVGGVPLSDVSFPDAEGVVHTLDDEAFQAKARLLVIFGTWCPNCNDLTEYLVDLDEHYEGLSIVGLAFEMGDDPEAHRRAVKTYAEHHGAKYPILIGGISDKAAASKAFPLVDKVRAYPTTVFMDGEGNVSAVHTGFSGPATGDAHAALKLRFESEIESLLAKD